MFIYTCKMHNSRDFKSQLNEFCQKKGIGPPIYNSSRVGGPDHLPEWQASVSVKNKKVNSEITRTKKEAEDRAAELCLLNFEINEPIKVNYPLEVNSPSKVNEPLEVIGGVLVLVDARLLCPYSVDFLKKRFMHSGSIIINSFKINPDNNSESSMELLIVLGGSMKTGVIDNYILVSNLFDTFSLRNCVNTYAEYANTTVPDVLVCKKLDDVLKELENLASFGRFSY